MSTLIEKGDVRVTGKEERKGEERREKAGIKGKRRRVGVWNFSRKSVRPSSAFRLERGQKRERTHRHEGEKSSWNWGLTPQAHS